MKVRKPTIDEWFLALQLKQVSKRLHLPFFVDIDLTAIHNAYEQKNKKTPYTAILIKAAAMILAQKPELNKMLFSTFYGYRFISFSSVTVNVPMLLQLDEKKLLTAFTVKEAHKKTIAEIQQEIKKASQRKWKELPINRLIHKKNSFFARIQLRLILFLINHFPSIYIKKSGGSISVSSLMNYNDPNIRLKVSAFSNTGLTLCSCSARQEGQKHILSLGISVEHMTYHGAEAIEGVQLLARILQSKNIDAFLYT